MSLLFLMLHGVGFCFNANTLCELTTDESKYDGNLSQTEDQEERVLSVDHMAELSDDLFKCYTLSDSSVPDVVFFINRVEVKVHRQILAARSAFFRFLQIKKETLHYSVKYLDRLKDFLENEAVYFHARSFHALLLMRCVISCGFYFIVIIK